MKFHDILKEIVAQHGPSILKERRLINILKDYNAFKDTPAFRGILTTLITEGYIDRLIDAGAWTPKAEAIASYLETNWAIPAVLTDTVVQSLAYALGYIPFVAIFTPQPTGKNNFLELCKIQPKGNPADFMLRAEELLEKSVSFQKEYCVKAAEYLDSLIDYRAFAAKKRGFKVRIFSQVIIFANPSVGLAWDVEITGPVKLLAETDTLRIVVYDHKDKVLGFVDRVLRRSQSKYQVYQTDYSIDESRITTIGNIGRILVYEHLEDR